MSAEFIAEEGVLKGLILSLGEEREEWVFGRDPDQCDVIIEDPRTSRKQLICRKTSEGYLIENLSPSNPLFINDDPVSGPVYLKERDRLTIGQSVFRFFPEGLDEGFAFGVEESDETADEFFTEETTQDAKFDTAETLGGEDLFDTPTENNELKDEISPATAEDASLMGVSDDTTDRETIFKPEELPEINIDLTPTTRFLIKVIAGPNTGAEFALDNSRSYLVGTDSSTCDVVFNDLSVSREHARLTVNAEGEIAIEDLDSRNGVIVDRERIDKATKLGPNSVVGLGTSAFLLIDREAPSETIAARIFEAPPEEKVEVITETPAPDEAVVAAKEAVLKPPASTGTFILALFIAGLAVLFGIGMVSLFHSSEVTPPKGRDYKQEINEVIKEFPAVQATLLNGKVFLVGHVRTSVEHNELLYKLRSIPYIKEIEDHVVNDQAVWQEMNILLSKHADFKGVSLHAPNPGEFVLSGYLQTEKQAANLIDYMNIHFNYLSKLQNKVVVEQQVLEEVTSRLMQRGFAAVNISFTNGELVLTGYVSSTQTYDFDNLLAEFENIPGVRSLKNFVVSVSPEQGVADLNKRYPGRFRVTGYSKHGDVNVNVVINGRILTRGDQLDGMTITSIQPHTIFLEKDGLKYKIDYNK